MQYLIYLIQVCLYSGVLWLIYCATFREKTFHRGSRIFLLMAALLPIILPLIHLNIAAGKSGWMYRYQLSEILVSAKNTTSHALVPQSGVSVFFLIAYFLVAFAIMSIYLLLYLRLSNAISSRGVAQRTDLYKIFTDTGLGPGTLWKRIFFPTSMVDKQILRHEQAHIALRHHQDLLLLQLLTAICWANPFVWMMLRELKLVHEFEADALTVGNENPADYSNLLLSGTFNLSFIKIVHSFFHHPIKRRIIMLQKEAGNTRPMSLCKKALAFTSCLILCSLLIQCKRSANDAPAKKTGEVNKPLSYEDTSGVDKDGRPYTIVTHFARLRFYESADVMPAFIGDLNNYLQQNLHYPDDARKERKEGRVIVRFGINEDGRVEIAEIKRSSGTRSLDHEAIRVVMAMPNWKPGSHKGEPVNVFFTLPVTFKLD